tara:strand:- start:8390 stop:8947 length:558 start_codon:yes stop_codon:yes gene_type:complete
MKIEIKRDVLEVLEEVIEILRVKEEKDVFELKQLSNYTTKDSLVFQDEDSISIGILIYALYKLVMRCYADDTIYKNLMAGLMNARDHLRKDHFVGYRKEIKKLFKLLSSIDKKLKLYVQEVIDQAKLKKGFKLFEGGVSASKAADLMGVSKWELMSYIGNTQVFDREKISTDIRKRLAFTRSLFK